MATPFNITSFILLFAILIISFGGAIRIHDAGESRPDWPKCQYLWLCHLEEEQAAYWEETRMKLIQEVPTTDIQCLRYF